MGSSIKLAEQNNSLESINKEKLQKVSSTFSKVLYGSIAFCFVSIFIFLWKRWCTLSCSQPIVYEIFGTLGDFIGGLLGTLVALYSVYLLVSTFQEQININTSVLETNESVIDTNNKLLEQSQLQIFDVRFTTLLNLYKDSIIAYNDEGVIGRINFEKIVDDFKTKGLEHNTEYKRRSSAAVLEYLNLYTEHRQNLSVHLRTLYLLAKLTAEEKINENYRVSYAKIIRGQLSEGELLILRYNLLSTYGEKMRTYVNRFNLLKHLPIMSLLEFTKWRKIINDDNHCSSINQIVVTLKKIMTRMLDSVGGVECEYRVSPRICFNLKLNESHNNFQILVNKQNKIKKGGALRRPPEENAFNKLSSGELNDFLKEILTEVFIYSNFFQFNGNNNHIVKSSIKSDINKETIILISIYRQGMPLALTDAQVLPSKQTL